MCRDGLFSQLRGTAACRGEGWAAELAEKRRDPWVPWPAGSAKVREAAVVRVADLTRDLRLREQLVDELIAWASKRWNAMGTGLAAHLLPNGAR